MTQRQQNLKKWVVRYDWNGELCHDTVEAPTGMDAKKMVYAKRGVKRMVGVYVQELGKAF